MYFAGVSAIYDLDYTRTIQTTGLYSIYIVLVIKDTLNLYCIGGLSCYSDDQVGYMQYMSNIFVRDHQGAHTSTVLDIFDRVYCNSFRACYSSIITNFENSVYGNGYQSLYSSTITNITNVCFFFYFLPFVVQGYEKNYVFCSCKTSKTCKQITKCFCK